MTTLSEIPKELFDIEKFHQFIDWLISIPLDLYTTRQYVKRWAAAVSYQMKRSDWEYVENAWIKSRANQGS